MGVDSGVDPPAAITPKAKAPFVQTVASSYKVRRGSLSARLLHPPGGTSPRTTCTKKEERSRKGLFEKRILKQHLLKAPMVIAGQFFSILIGTGVITSPR